MWDIRISSVWQRRTLAASNPNGQSQEDVWKPRDVVSRYTRRMRRYVPSVHAETASEQHGLRQTGRGAVGPGMYSTVTKTSRCEVLDKYEQSAVQVTAQMRQSTYQLPQIRHQNRRRGRLKGLLRVPFVMLSSPGKFAQTGLRPTSHIILKQQSVGAAPLRKCERHVPLIPGDVALNASPPGGRCGRSY